MSPGSYQVWMIQGPVRSTVRTHAMSIWRYFSRVAPRAGPATFLANLETTSTSTRRHAPRQFNLSRPMIYGLSSRVTCQRTKNMTRSGNRPSRRAKKGRAAWAALGVPGQRGREGPPASRTGLREPPPIGPSLPHGGDWQPARTGRLALVLFRSPRFRAKSGPEGREGFGPRGCRLGNCLTVLGGA